MTKIDLSPLLDARVDVAHKVLHLCIREEKMQRVFAAFAVVALPAFAAVAAAPLAPFRTHGSVVIKTQQYETMVIVRSGDDDGPADHVFHLWAKPALQVDGGYRAAQVEFNGSSLMLIIPTQQRALTFTVSGRASVETAIPEGLSATGYGLMGMNHEVGTRAEHQLVRNTGPSPFASCDAGCDYADFEVPDPWDFSASGGGSCTSGGVYSTSCSQSNSSGSCSVSCADGTYACCTNGNPPTCTCKPRV